MPISDEKKNFKKRLLQALQGAGMGDVGAAHVAREFNLRYHGTAVTAQSVSKWLGGKAIPAQDKLRVLASWLGVPVQWLRYGESEGEGGEMPTGARLLRQDSPVYAVEQEVWSRNYQRLNAANKKIVQEIMLALLKAQRKK